MAAKFDDDEYVTQLLGFTPKAFVDGIYNALNDYIKEFFKEIGKVLGDEFAKGDEILSSKIREGCKELIAKCHQNVDKNIDKLEMYLLKNIFFIPSSVLLPEDQVHKELSVLINENSITETSVDQEILELKTGILREINFRKLLQYEQERLKNILAEVKRSAEALIIYIVICNNVK